MTKTQAIFSTATLFAVVGTAAFFASNLWQSQAQAPRERPVGPPPVAAVKRDVPKDGTVYVWSLPTSGHQSIICLGVVDGNTIDGAYLLPVRIRLDGAVAPGIDEKGGKEAQAALEKLVGGQLRTVQLLGVDQKSGNVSGDIWLAPDKEGEKGQWLSEALIKAGVAKSEK